jgi:hypothetical protein
MKNALLFCTCFLLTALGALGQKRATDLLPTGHQGLFFPQKTNVPPNFRLEVEKMQTNFMIGPRELQEQIDGSPEVDNLVSRPSFKKIYRRDFSKLNGNNNLPTNQLILSLNKPEIQIGQLIPLYHDSTRTVPTLGIYPYVQGKLSKTDDLRLTKDGEIDPRIGFGGRIVFIPAGQRGYTGYYYDKKDTTSQLFIEKNNISKAKLAFKYDTTTLKRKASELEAKIKNNEEQGNKLLLLANYFIDSTSFTFSTTPKGDTLVAIYKPEWTLISSGIEPGRPYTLTFSIAELQKVSNQNLEKSRRIDSVITVPDKPVLIYMSASPAPLPFKSLIDTTEFNKLEAELLEQRNQLATELFTVRELLKKPGKLRGIVEDLVYEEEKNARWHTRTFFWFTVEGNTINQTVNILQDNTIKENENFRKNSWGGSANYAVFTPKFILSLLAKVEYTRTNKFFENDPNTYAQDSLISNTKYRIAKPYEAYDVNGLSASELLRTSTNRSLTLGSTLLVGGEKKYGINFNYARDMKSKVVNVKAGVIIPIIMDNAKADQTNVILELILPDISTKTKNSLEALSKDGKTWWDRRYFNLKVGIPINLL